MENLLKRALHEVVEFLENHHYRYAVIGGIANQIWGQARFTYDIDVKVFVPDFDYDRVRQDIRTAFSSVGRPELPMNPLILSIKIGEVIVDFLLTTPGYEEQIIERAQKCAINEMSLWVCTAEDLVIQKAIANRPKDWQDIEGIIIEQSHRLNRQYIERWLAEFAEILENPAIMKHYQEICQKIS